MRFYIVEDQWPSNKTPFSCGPTLKNGRREYGFYYDRSEYSWQSVVIDSHFSVIALGYDEAHNDYCTVLEIERPHGEVERFFWWWDGHYSEEDGDSYRLLNEEVRHLRTYYGMQIVCDLEVFDRCMMSYRRDSSIQEWFATIDDLKEYIDHRYDADKPMTEAKEEAKPTAAEGGNAAELEQDDFEYMLSRGTSWKNADYPASH